MAKANNKNPLLIQVSEGTEVIGHIAPDQFRTWMRRSNRKFLADLVEEFNSGKAAAGEPERVAVVINKAA